MKIYTSYYKKLADCLYDLVPVRVSNSVPKWFPWGTWPLTDVYPKWSLVNGLKNNEISQEEFREQYLEQLSHLDKNVILGTLQEISALNEDKDIVLMCWEGSTYFCHRHILAEWLDADIVELG